MPKTTNLDLVLTEDTSSEKFLNWRKDINGVDTSNMSKIDDFAGKFKDGTSGQYLKKSTDNNFDMAWESPDSVPTPDSDKLITSKGVYGAIEEINTLNKVIVIAEGDVSQEMIPNVFYLFTGLLTSLTITLRTGSDSKENEYKGQFSTSTTAPIVIFPDTIVWIGEAPTIETNKIYQFSILNNIGVIVGV